VTGFGPCAQGLRGNFYVHVAGETQPRLVHGDVEAKLELREFMLEPRHEHASKKKSKCRPDSATSRKTDTKLADVLTRIIRG